MAASLISVISRIGEALIQEVNFLSEVGNQFERCQAELRSIEGFFETVNAMSDKNPEILAWVASVQDVVYDMDDILSEFFIEVAEVKRRSKKFLERIACFPAKQVNFHKLGNKIEEIFIRIEDVSKRRRRYAVEMGHGASSSTTTDEVVRMRRAFQHVKDVDLVGLDEATSSLVEELKKNEVRLCVVSICGMGGIGKTTLAKLVYNRNDVMNHFDVHAWTFVSQQCKTEDVLREVLGQVGSFAKEEIQRMNEVELVKTLFDTLTRRRYLVVLDDIWHVKDWVLLRSAFPDGLSGSKVMLTTRYKKIAEEADPRSTPFEPKFLDEEKSWDLMCRKSLSTQDMENVVMSIDFERCGKEMMKKCGGLPLAIVVLGGILAKKKSLVEWQDVSKLIAFHMSQGETGVHAILGLSITYLPLHLKPLFFYLGLFPEDYKIPVTSLIRMWIAEGLLTDVHGNVLTMESIGRHYLDELIQRCVVQIDKRNTKGVKTCQMHDMMLEVCIDRERQENFLEIIKQDMSSSSSSGRKIRRCAIYLEDERYVVPPQATPRMRSVIFFQMSKTSEFYMDHKDFKLVRVLELMGVSNPSLEEVGKLVNLRYLGLRLTDLGSLPKSIGNLVNLQILDVRENFNLEIPDVIWKLEELRHFLWNQFACEKSHPLRMDKLKKLQTLSSVRAESWTSGMSKMVNLERLGITNLTPDRLEMVIDSITCGFHKLRSLSLKMSTKYGGSFSNLERFSEKHELLKLELYGGMNSFLKHWPPNIVNLKVILSYSVEDPMPILERLEHLTHLTLWGAYRSKKIVCGGGGFPKLDYLRIISFPNLEEWVVENGAMPALTKCVLQKSKKLKKIPEGFKFVITLQKLEIINMSTEFVQRVKQGGEDWESIKHVPSIVTDT